jgi:hypothetical protein
MWSLLQAGLDAGFLGTLAEFATVAGAVILLGLLAAFGAFAYRSLRGDLEWPDDEEGEDEEGVTRTGSDDEWKFS